MHHRAQSGSNKSGWRRWWPGVDLHLLQQEVCPSLCKHWERVMHLEDGHHMAELATQAMEEHEHQLPIADGVAKLSETGGHRLKMAIVVSDAQDVLAEVVELRFEEEHTGLPLAEELVHEVAPGTMSGSLPHH